LPGLTCPPPKLIAAAIEFCDGFTNVPVAEMLEHIKRAMRDQALEPTFEQFLKAHSDKSGLVAFIGITAANVYRTVDGTMLKGEGCSVT